MSEQRVYSVSEIERLHIERDGLILTIELQGQTIRDLKAALEEIQELAGSHTVVRLEAWETPPEDGGFAHLYRIAKQALESGDDD